MISIIVGEYKLVCDDMVCGRQQFLLVLHYLSAALTLYHTIPTFKDPENEDF